MTFEEQSEQSPLTSAQEQVLKADAVERADKAVKAIMAATTDEEFLYYAPQAAIGAFRLENYTLAAELAQKSLSLLESREKSWNTGNVIHYSYTVLGLLAVRRDEIDEALNDLRLAGATPGSPQLNTFGPTMELAKALAKVNEFAGALEYVQQCRVFWKMGTDWLDVWERKLKHGEVPNCFMHSFR